MPSTSRMSNPRLADVADRAGVSLSTASRALAGTAPVSPELARRVTEAATALRYTVNPHARTLAGGLATVLGLMVYEIDDPYFAEISAGVIEVADAHGWSVHVTHQQRDPARDLATVQRLRSQRVGAIVVVGSGYLDPERDRLVTRELEEFAASGGRAVLIGRRSVVAPAVDTVAVDNAGVGRVVAEHLLQLGHRRIGVAAGPATLTTVHDRLQGILAALRAADYPDPPVVHAEFSRAGGRVAAAALLDSDEPPTAILALNDTMAIGALSVLREHGLATPDQVSVTGVGDILLAQDLAPALTTIRLPMARMGELAAELALTERGADPRSVAIEHELVVRASSGAAPPS